MLNNIQKAIVFLGILSLVYFVTFTPKTQYINSNILKANTYGEMANIIDWRSTLVYTGITIIITFALLLITKSYDKNNLLDNNDTIEQ